MHYVHMCLACERMIYNQYQDMLVCTVCTVRERHKPRKHVYSRTMTDTEEMEREDEDVNKKPQQKPCVHQ